MGTLFTLDPSVVAVAKQAVTDLIHNLGKDCRLIWPARWQACSNCGTDPRTGRSLNVWRTGGPVPFQEGSLCPLCNGQGKSAVEATQTVTMLLAITPKDWFVRAPAGVQIPDGAIQSKGFAADLPAVLQARQMVVESLVEPLNRYRYILHGEPVDPGNIVQGAFWVATWRRTGG